MKKIAVQQLTVIFFLIPIGLSAQIKKVTSPLKGAAVVNAYDSTLMHKYPVIKVAPGKEAINRGNDDNGIKTTDVAKINNVTFINNISLNNKKIVLNPCQLGSPVNTIFAAWLSLSKAHVYCGPISPAIGISQTEQNISYPVTLKAVMPDTKRHMISFEVGGSESKNFALSYQPERGSQGANVLTFGLSGPGKKTITFIVDASSDSVVSSSYEVTLSSPDMGSYEIYSCTIEELN